MTKFERACRQLDCLERKIAAWNDDQARKVTRDFNPRSRHGTAKTIVDPLPRDWSLLIGDCAHNFRSSLDHLVFEISAIGFSDRVIPEDDARGIGFPIYGTREPKAHEWRRSVGFLPEDAQAIVRDLQPHSRGDAYLDDLLWLLYEVDRFDKHRYINLTVSAVKGAHGIEVNVKDSRIRIWGGGAMRFGVEEQIAEWWLTPVDPKRGVELYIHFSFEVAFGQGPPAYGRYVRGLLGEIRDYIASEVFT